MRARRAQAGVAAITAVLVVAVAASAAAVMLAQQSALLNQAALIAARAQADLHARAGLDWARGILAEDARAGGVDSLADRWAQPIAGLPVERALVSGRLTDEQGRFNLNNVVRGNERSQPDIQILRRLLEGLALAPDLAEAIVDWIDFDADLAGPAGAEDAYYLALARPYRAANQAMVQVEELHRVRGFDAKAVARLKPFVTALPARTPVNANTAAPEVLAAILPELGPEEVRSLVASRAGRPFRSRDDLRERARKAAPNAIASDLDVGSAWFSAQVLVQQDEVELATEALIRRGANAATAIIWRRPLY